MEKKNKKYHYTRENIIDAFEKIGLKKGDSVFIHSNIGFFGVLRDAFSKEDYYKIFKDGILKIIGREGTLVVPTFSYSYCKNKVFIPEKTPGVGGLFAEMLRRDSQSVRSIDPNFSVAAIGKKAKYFTDFPPKHSFGKDSFWERFLKSKGIFVNFNFDAGSTFIHYIEKKINVPYRYDKAFHGFSLIKGQKKPGLFYHFVYDFKKPSNFPDFVKFDRKAKKLGLAKTVNLGKGQIVSITAEDTFNLINQEFKNDPAFLIKGDFYC